MPKCWKSSESRSHAHEGAVRSKRMSKQTVHLSPRSGAVLQPANTVKPMVNIIIRVNKRHPPLLAKTDILLLTHPVLLLRMNIRIIEKDSRPDTRRQQRLNDLPGARGATGMQENGFFRRRQSGTAVAVQREANSSSAHYIPNTPPPPRMGRLVKMRQWTTFSSPLGQSRPRAS